MKAMILRGLPGSGKSTWAHAYCVKNKDWLRLNRDDLRNMRGQYWIPKQEGVITEWIKSMITVALEGGKNVIIDETSLNPKYHKEMVEYLEFVGFQVQIKEFNTSLSKCIENDLKRPNSVGEKVIRDMHDKYIAIKREQYEPNNDRPKAVIFDIDGTLADMTGLRSPYDWDKVDLDVVKTPVKFLADMYRSAGYEILIFTGRDGEAELKTIKWLLDNEIDYSEFEIRPKGDTRPDWQVKEEMFDKFKDVFSIECVYDDRNQMVDYWRSIGLQCFQVNYGDF